MTERRPVRSPAALARAERPHRMYERLVQQLCDYIRGAGLTPGERLPAERELAQALGVSRASVSQALVALEVRGVVAVRHGDGAVLLGDALTSDVLSAMRARRRRISEVLEAREALEVKLAEFAALRRTTADLERIQAALDAMRAEIAGGGRGIQGDERFHRAVTAAARSQLLADIMTELAPSIAESRVESLAQPGRPPRSLRDHERIAAAIERGDPRAAARAMAGHVRRVADVALLRKE